MSLPSPSSVLLRTQSDERLVVLARAGHERAFEAIVERHRGGMLRVARRYLPDARAEDSIQHAFLAAWSALQRGDDVRDLRAWLHRIARNSALNQLRATGYDYAELEESVRAGDAPADALERRTAMRQTLTGLAALPERQREALLRIAVEGRSQDEVARELGVSSGAVRQLVHRARHTLRAAATAVVPMPVATWLASGGGAAAEAVGGAGAAALLAKGAAVIFATGVAATPIIVAAEPDRPGHPPVRHAALNAFIGRNYECDAHGQWFFQNGPQRVYVELAYTPWVVRLAERDGQLTLADQTGAPFEPDAAWLDDAGGVLFRAAGTPPRVAALHDHDLGLFADHADFDATPPVLRWRDGRTLALGNLACADVPATFGFVASPAQRARRDTPEGGNGNGNSNGSAAS